MDVHSMIELVCNIWTPISPMSSMNNCKVSPFLGPSDGLGPPAWCVVFLKSTDYTVLQY